MGGRRSKKGNSVGRRKSWKRGELGQKTTIKERVFVRDRDRAAEKPGEGETYG